MSRNNVWSFCLLASIVTILTRDVVSKPVSAISPPRFSTKTAYRLAAHPGGYGSQKPPQCTAVHVNFVGRHGTRFPSENDVRKFEDLQKTINKHITNTGRLHRSFGIEIPWRNVFNIESSSNITSIGIQEFHGIAERLIHTFPELLPRNLSSFDSTLYKFSSTCKERSILSASAARRGMFAVFKENASKFTRDIPIHQSDCNNDPLLRFYKMCPRYKKEVDNNIGTLKEYETFLMGKEMKSVVENISIRLGIVDRKEITVQRVQAMYKYCAFSVALNMTSGFCSLFREQDLRVLEYAEDLKYFYEDSTAYNITKKMSCLLLRDIVFDMMVSSGKKADRKRHNVVTRIGHSSTILPLLALMGIRTSRVDLVAGIYSNMTGRAFRTSTLAPFATNIAVVLYECEDHWKRVQLYLNEQLVEVPFCKDAKDCLLDDFLAYYQMETDSCNLSQYCQV